MMANPQLPNETLIYNTKIKPVGAIFVFGIFALIGLALVYQTVAGNGSGRIVTGLLALALLGYAGYFLKKKILEMSDSKVQIKLSLQGIETAGVPFKKWSEINMIKIHTDTSEMHRVHQLIYTFKGGRADLIINNMTVSKEEIEVLIDKYQRQSRIETMGEEDIPAKPDDSKGKMIDDFFK